MFLSTAALLLLLAAPPSVRNAQTEQQAAVALKAGRITEAIGLYREALGRRPGWREGWWQLGTLLFAQERFAEAQPALARFVSSAPQPGPALALLGVAEYENGDLAPASSHLRKWAAHGFAGPTDTVALGRFHLALLLTKTGEFERASALLEEQVARGLAGPAVKEALGLAALRLPFTPRDYPPNERERIMMAGQVAMLIGQDQLTRALHALAALRSRFPDSPETDYFAGTALLRHSRSEASTAFRRELQRNSRHVPAMLQLAEDALARSEPQEGLDWAAKAVEVAPHDFGAHAVYGRVLYALARYEDSAKELEAAKRIAPDSYAVRIALARTYDELGRTTEADRERLASERLRERAP